MIAYPTRGSFGFLIVLMLGVPAWGDQRDWDGGGGPDTDWSTAANWTDNTEPTDFDSASIGNGFVASITRSGEECARLEVGAAAGQTGTVRMSGGDLTTMYDTYLGESGTGRFVNTGGLHTTRYLFLGTDVDAFGEYTLSGTGQLRSTYLTVGGQGTGVITQTGGTHTAERMYMGGPGSSPDEYHLSNGTFSSITSYVGYLGTGRFTHIGGTHETGYLYLGFGSEQPAVGTYELSGAGSLQAASLEVGSSGIGSFVQTGGTSSTHRVVLANNSTNAQGTYSINGSSVLDTEWLEIGKKGTGHFIQTGGSVSVAGMTQLGTYTHGAGIYDHAAGTLTTEQLSIAAAPSTGTYNLSGSAQLHVCGDERLAEFGEGTFNQTGGTHVVDGTLIIGAETGGVGTYNLDGGSLVASTVQIGRTGCGEFNLRAGTVDANRIIVQQHASEGIEGHLNIHRDWTYDGSLEVGTLGRVDAFNNTITLSAAGAGAAAVLYGRLSAGSLVVGRNAGESGSVVADADMTLQGTLRLGASAGSSGSFATSGRLETQTTIVGDGGDGVFTQTYAYHGASTAVRIGMGNGSRGTYNLTGGNGLWTPVLQIGGSGEGTFNCSSGARIVIEDVLEFGPLASFSATPGSKVRMQGADWRMLAQAGRAHALAGLGNLELIFEGGAGDTSLLELAGRPDLGFTDNFAVGTLTLGGLDAGAVKLVDLIDNGNRVADREALFVHHIAISDASRLDVNGLPLYVEGNVESLLDGWIGGGNSGRLFDSTLTGNLYLDAIYVPAGNWTTLTVVPEPVSGVCFLLAFSIRAVRRRGIG